MNRDILGFLKDSFFCVVASFRGAIRDLTDNKLTEVSTDLQTVKR